MKREFQRAIVVVCLALACHGCKTATSMRQEMLDAVPVNDLSYIVGKYTVSCTPDEKTGRCNPKFNLMAVYFEHLGEGDFPGEIVVAIESVFATFAVFDAIDSEAQMGSIYFCQALPPGEYALERLQYWNYAGGGSGFITTDDRTFSVPFTAESGNLSVLDHLIVTTRDSKNFLGRPRSMPGTLSFSRLTDSELALATGKCPEGSRTKPTVSQGLYNTATLDPFGS